MHSLLWLLAGALGPGLSVALMMLLSKRQPKELIRIHKKETRTEITFVESSTPDYIYRIDHSLNSLSVILVSKAKMEAELLWAEKENQCVSRLEFEYSLLQALPHCEIQR